MIDINCLQPIRNYSDIQRMYMSAVRHDESKGKSDYSWYLLLLIGFHSAYRVSDLLQLRARDIRGNAINVRARKTHKESRIVMPADIRKEAAAITESYADDDYLFQSARSHGKPVRRETIYKALNIMAKEAGIDMPIGCHTLRKTFAYHYYKQYNDIATLQKVLGHAARRDTLTYIGITEAVKDKQTSEFYAIAPMNIARKHSVDFDYKDNRILTKAGIKYRKTRNKE